MPNIKSFDITQNITALPNANLNGGVVPDAFGMGVSRAVQQLGQSLSMDAKVMERKQEEDARVEALEKKSKYMEGIFEDLNNQESGLLNTKGGQADGASKRFAESSKKRREEIEATITNPYAKRIFQEHAFNVTMAGLNDVSKHEQREHVARIDNAYVSSNKNSVAMGVMNYTSPETVKFYETEIEGATTGRWRGQDKVKVDDEIRKEKTKYFSAIFKRYIDSNNTQGAEAVLKENESKMDPEVVGLLRTNQLKPAQKFDRYQLAMSETAGMTVDQVNAYVNGRKDWTSEDKMGFIGFKSGNDARKRNEESRYETEQFKGAINSLQPFIDAKDRNGGIKYIQTNLPLKNQQAAISMLDFHITGIDNKPSDKEAVWDMYKKVNSGEITDEDTLKRVYGPNVNIHEIISYANVMKQMKAGYEKANAIPPGFKFLEEAAYKLKKESIDESEDRAAVWEVFNNRIAEMKTKNNGKLPDNQAMLSVFEEIVAKRITVKLGRIWDSEGKIYELQKQNPGVIILIDEKTKLPYKMVDGKKVVVELR